MENNYYEEVCGDNKEKLFKFGMFVAKENKIEQGKEDLENYIDIMLASEEQQKLYKKDIDVFKINIFNYICFKDYCFKTDGNNIDVAWYKLKDIDRLRNCIIGRDVIEVIKENDIEHCLVDIDESIIIKTNEGIVIDDEPLDMMNNCEYIKAYYNQKGANVYNIYFDKNKVITDVRANE